MRQSFKARIVRLEEVLAKKLSPVLEPLAPSEWDAIIQRAKEDTRTLKERLEELRRPTVFQDPRSPTEHERLHEEIRTYWAEVFERRTRTNGRGSEGSRERVAPLPGGAELVEALRQALARRGS